MDVRGGCFWGGAVRRRMWTKENTQTHVRDGHACACVLTEHTRPRVAVCGQMTLKPHACALQHEREQGGEVVSAVTRSSEKLVATKTGSRGHWRNVSQGPPGTELEYRAKWALPPCFPDSSPGFTSYNLRKTAGKRFLISRKNCSFGGAVKIAGFKEF